MGDRPIPKGRGALLEMLKRQKEAKAGGGDPQEEIPPKSRGRAALLQKLQEMKQKTVGLSAQTHESSQGPSVAPSVSKSREEKLSHGVSNLSITTPSEPCTYQGQVGTPLRATANYIRLEVEEGRGFYEYEVRFQPEVDARSNRSRLINQALEEISPIKIYDGDVNLYLPTQIFSDRREYDSVIPHTDQPVKTILIFKRKKKFGERDCIHLLNVFFKRIMRILLYNRIGKNYFSPDHKHIVPQHKLEVLPGFAVHVDEMEGGLMVMVDTQHRVIRSQTVYELLQELMAAFPRTIKEEAVKNIMGTCVLTKYNNKTYIVDDIRFDMCPRDTFDTKNGPVTFVEYYKQNYNIQIGDIEQPLLISKQTVTVKSEKVDRLVCLIPELCYLTGLSDAMRSDFKVMKDVAVFTRVTPNQRALALRTYLERVRNSQEAQKVLADWGLKLAGGTTDLPARVLPQEAIYFGGPRAEERKFTGGTDWNRAVGENVLTGPIDIITWQLYYTRRDQEYAANFAETLVRLANGMGCIIRNPQHIVLDNDRADTYMLAIKNNVTSAVQVAVFICPTIRVDRYSIIKKMCCIDSPLASQVILSKTLANQQKVRTIIHKIGMQITCKLGGSLWSVKIPFTGWMICGIDVYHGTNKQSVCGFVSSINDSLTRYYSEAMFQGGEIGDFFKTAFGKALKHHKDRTGNFPQRVIIFRDGVGDGQLEHCRRYEVGQFLEVLRALNIETTLTFVVVQKRINTRIFRVVDERNYENPPSGTVVDSMVTRRNYADFFLVPQSVRQGTVNPTHYIVVHNDGNIKPDHLQRLAYKLCHLYYNWSGTIRVPAPCLYAHKLASLVGQYVKKLPSPELNDKLYYL